jgi:hypothetical protein
MAHLINQVYVPPPQLAAAVAHDILYAKASANKYYGMDVAPWVGGVKVLADGEAATTKKVVQE